MAQRKASQVWKPKIDAIFDAEKYREIYSSEFLKEIISDLKITNKKGKKEMEAVILTAAMEYEMKRRNFNYYKSKTERKGLITKLKTGLNKSKNAYNDIYNDKSRIFFADLAISMGILKEKSNSPLIHSISGNPKDFTNLMEFMTNACDDALERIKSAKRENSGDALFYWFNRVGPIWRKYSGITYTEGNPDYKGYSPAVLIAEKILKLLDSKITQSAIAWVIKETKS